MCQKQSKMIASNCLSVSYSRLPQWLITTTFQSTRSANMKCWHKVQQFLSHIWRRLVCDYLPTLTKRVMCTGCKECQPCGFLFKVYDETRNLVCDTSNWRLLCVRQRTSRIEGKNCLRQNRAHGAVELKSVFSKREKRTIWAE